MKRVETNEIQPMLLEILKVFDKYCTDNGFKYFISDGTLIGAIRHHGFIPWDDDIDVSMVYDEYDRLLERAKQDPYLDADKRFRFLLPATMPNFYPFMKVIDTTTLLYEKDTDHKYATGMWIDIFRYSQCPDDLEDVQRIFKTRDRYKNMNRIAVCGNLQTPYYKRIYPLVAIAKVGLRLTGSTPKVTSQKILELEKQPNVSGNTLCNIAWGDSYKHIYKREWFDEFIRVDFEGYDFPVPACYDEVLKSQFGDYMQLPPEDQRIRHDFEAYKLD